MAIRPPLTATVRGGQGKPDRDEEMDVSWSNKEMETGRRSNLTIIAPYKGLGADSEEKREPVSDIDTAAADSLKVLDLKRPIREADIE